MKTNKAQNIVRKIAATGVAATLMSTTLVGGLAANLADLPAPFVQDGQPDFKVVIGQTADPRDVLGSIDIATQLQAAAFTETSVNVPGAETDYSVEGDGIEVAQAGDDLNFNESFELGSNLKFDSNDLPDLLRDGAIKDQDENEEWEYDQEVQFNDTSFPRVSFGLPDSDVDEPQLFVDFGTASTPAYRVVVDFDETSKLGATSSTDTGGLQDSETIEILGKVFTFDPDNKAGDSDFTLFGSDVVTFLELNVPQTIDVEGSTVEVEVVGANSEGTTDTVILSVNGQRETVEEGQSRTIGGIEVFIQDVFVTNIPTLDASATIFVGSDEYKLDQDTGFNRVELNGNDLDGIYFALNSISGNAAEINETDDFTFEFRPEDLDADEDQYLLAGESVTDPLFDVDLIFAGPRPALNAEERSFLEFSRSGDEYEVTITNRDGDVYEDIPLFEESASNQIRYVQDGSGDTKRLILDPSEFSDEFTEDDFFITYEGSVSNAISKIYSVKDFERDNNVNSTVFVDLATGQEEEVEVGDTLGSTQLTIATIDHNSRQVTFSSTARIVNWFITEGELRMNLGPVYGDNGTGFITTNNPEVAGYTLNTLNQSDAWHNSTASASEVIPVFFDEDWEDDFLDESDDVVAGNWTLTFGGDASDDDIEIKSTSFNATGGRTEINGDSEFDDFDYSMTAYGSYVIEETEEDGQYFRVWYPKDGEADYVVFFSPEGGAIQTTSASGGSLTTQRVNAVAVGASVLDVDVNLATESSNLIVVGGPRANIVADELLGNPSDEEINEMFPSPGSAVIKLFDLDSGKVAMLVAGYSADDTQAASRAVATFDNRLSGDEATLQVANINSVSITTN